MGFCICGLRLVWWFCVGDLGLRFLNCVVFGFRVLVFWFAVFGLLGAWVSLVVLACGVDFWLGILGVLIWECVVWFLRRAEVCALCLLFVGFGVFVLLDFRLGGGCACLDLGFCCYVCYLLFCACG